jgi:enamine deaminase RidA (YjgF/YER057c/UK114 family)
MHTPLSPIDIHPPFAPYSHGVELPGGQRLVFCSGQLGIGKDGAIPPDCTGQARLCFDNIRAILEEAGMGLANIVRINAYVTGREHLAPYMAVRNGLFSAPLPASTLMVVAGLARPEFVIEIEVVAAGPDARRD